MKSALTPLREAAKNAAGRLASAALPQCDYGRSLFVLGHMRCGSTALSNVLCSRPEISGYGEAHITYDGPGALGRLVVNQRRRGAWKPGARYLFDKVLHARYDGTVERGMARGRAIFMVREPRSSIRSIRTLFDRIGSHQYATDREAADYYEQRLQSLAHLWRAFPAERRLGTSYAALTAAPDSVLARLSALLELDPPLANAYVASEQTRRPGAGDPLSSHRFTSIVAPEASTTIGQAPAELDLAPGQLDRLEQLYASVCTLFAADEQRDRQTA
jgi:hypothetical protein